ncbi:MAG: TSUP family transporter [Pseudomonadales bacterium]
MSELLWYQYLFIGLLFIWSGFVRSGLGFGGAVLSLPFLLMIDNQPLVFLPIIAVHLLVFSFLTVWQNNRKILNDTAANNEGSIDWRYLRFALSIIIIPKMIGIFGLITLPANIMSGVIFGIVALYSITYILDKPFKSTSRTLDILFLMLGGYISGTSLIGAPLIVAVLATHVAKEKLRDTLFVLWFILVGIKIVAFVYAGVDLQLIHHLWLLPCAALGHIIGLRAHDYLLQSQPTRFFRILGSLLLTVSLFGLYQGLSG